VTYHRVEAIYYNLTQSR